ncbi:MAG: hypothetical protein WBW41_12670 [Verrucomicrobiia bacterium]
MYRDPLYWQIRRRLRELKDGNAFELCANDLLRKLHPSLAPREGGDDAGLDGKIVEQDGRSIQLVCTTSKGFKEIAANLTGSIQVNIKKGGKSYACIFATPQRLTNSQKRTLYTQANELGRPLIEIYDQAWFTLLLYRDARWLKDLLALTGNPPPLSLFPITRRPLFDIPPVGRDKDLAKFANLAQDFVLVGQPGSGKTHLLFTAAKKFKGRFVVDDDRTLVADGVRNIQPRFLIVDDAHSRLEFLKRLILLRQQIGGDFRIVASCWPGQEVAVSDALHIPTEKCHALEGLPQKLIKEVIQSQKILGPDHLVAEIIHQSQGKPGLAVTLCRLCWESGSSRDVMLGTALARDVKLSFEPLLGEPATNLLGCFSIGGDAGMSLESVARLLGKNALEVRRTVEQLSAAGVLDVSPENRISVHPFRLRQALVRDVFLKPPVVDLTPYLSAAPDYAASTRVLIEAKLMGGVLPDEILQERLQHLAETYEQSAFEEYVHLGRHEAEWVLDNYPNKLKAVASAALNASPDKTLGMLLDSAAVTYNERSAQGWSFRTEDVMPEIKRWILSARPNDDEAYERRKFLAASLEKWFAANKNPFVGVQAAELVLSIKHEATSTPPGEPMTMTFHFGVVTQNQLHRIASLWPKILPILREAAPSQESSIANIFHEWIHPDFHGRNTPKEYENESHSLAKQMMTELLAAFEGNWTMHHYMHNYAEKLGLLANIKIDPIAEILYPPRDFLDWEKENARRSAAADELASQLKDKDPVSVANLLTPIEQQARAANISYPSWGGHVCWRIADTTDNPAVWIQALLDSGAPAYLLEPFFEKAAVKQPSDAEIGILLVSDKPDSQALGIGLVLKYSLPGTSIWQQASPLLKNYTSYIEGCVLRKEIRNENLKALLNHDEPMVSGVVAANLWGIRDDAKIPDDLFEDWKRVIIRHVDKREEHILEKIFPKFPDIAFEWISWRLEGIRTDSRAFYFGLRYDRALPAAVGALTKEQRRKLIDELPRTSAVAELVRSLVSRDMELFLHLLSREELEGVRLDPLRIDNNDRPNPQPVVQEFDEGWQKMAIAAIEKGFSEADIFSATQGGGFSWSGPMSSMFAAKLVPFEKLLRHPDARLRNVGKIGFEHFSNLRDEHLAAEKRAAVRGELA